MEALAFVAIALVAIGGIVLSVYLKARRREAFQAFAGRHGLEYSQRDPFQLLGWPFPLFSKGDGRGTDNVVWGDWQGQPITAFDYWYYVESTDSEGHRSRSYRRFSCAQIEVPAAFPVIELAPEGFFTRLADQVGLRDIDFELEEFNRRWNVKARDRKFAFDLIDQRMMRWLLSLEQKISFEVVGNRVLAYGRQVKPELLVPIIGAATTFRDRIPRAAWSLYPVS